MNRFSCTRIWNRIPPQMVAAEIPGLGFTNISTEKPFTFV
jgi:hypothetical protein